MCGIFGTTDFSKTKLDVCRKALHSLKHRGENQSGEWIDDTKYIGHQRLSILDLSENGRQPMLDESKNIIITVNGEIYNFQELRSQLQKNHCFKSNSDSEIILHGYIEWGIEKLVEKIEGMFAFAILDLKQQKIYLVRDRVGIKPLFYSLKNNSLTWASELKAIVQLYKNELSINNSALYDFLTYLYIPTPKTAYNEIYKLEPAHYVEYNIADSSFQKHCYWQLKVETTSINLENATQQLQKLIRKSVKEQMVSDVEVGFFLSGGIDSSIVVAEASQLSSFINTYSIGFDVEAHDETKYAQIVANIYKTQHRQKILDLHKTEELFDNIAHWYDEPYADLSAMPTFLVSCFAKETSTVVLSGDGGDELFGGYSNYSRFKNLSNSIPSFIKSPISDLSSLKNIFPIGSFFRRAGDKFQKYFLSDIELYAKLMGGMLKKDKKKWKKRLNIPDNYDDYWYFRKFYRPELPLFTRLQYLDFHTYLHDDILTKVDRVSMAVSLEVRVPLLSTELIEFCFSLPESIRMYNNTLKGLVKHAYSKVLPEEILHRKKKGFSIPPQYYQLKTTSDYQLYTEKMVEDFIAIV